MRKTTERTAKTIKKSQHFEQGGEALSVEVCLENIPPNIRTDTIISFLDTLFERIKEELSGRQT